MKIIIEVSGGIVQSVFCDEPDGVEVVMRDFDDIYVGGDDPFIEQPALAEMRNPRFAIY